MKFGLVEKLTNANGILIHFTSFYLNYFLTSPVRILFVEKKAGIETLPLWHNREEQPMIKSAVACLVQFPVATYVKEILSAEHKKHNNPMS